MTFISLEITEGLVYVKTKDRNIYKRDFHELLVTLSSVQIPKVIKILNALLNIQKSYKT